MLQKKLNKMSKHSWLQGLYFLSFFLCKNKSKIGALGGSLGGTCADGRGLKAQEKPQNSTKTTSLLNPSQFQGSLSILISSKWSKLG